MKRLIHKLFGRNVSSTRKATRTNLSIEALEDRWCPSVNVSTIDNGHTLVINGDNAANNVSILDDGVNDDLIVRVNGVARPALSSSAINKIVVNLKGGNDVLNYQLPANGNFQFAKNIVLDLGLGNDQAAFDLLHNVANNPEADARIQAPLTLSVNGSTGDDKVGMKLGVIEGVDVKVTARMGAGKDSFDADLVGDVAANADLLFDIKGEAGNDGLTVETDQVVRMDPGSTLKVTLDGGLGTDSAEMKYRGRLDGVIDLLIDGGLGADFVLFGDIQNTGGNSTVNATVRGGAGNDTLALFIANFVTNSAIVNGLLDGGLGRDFGQVSGDVTQVSVESAI